MNSFNNSVSVVYTSDIVDRLLHIVHRVLFTIVYIKEQIFNKFADQHIRSSDCSMSSLAIIIMTVTITITILARVSFNFN